MSTALPCFGSGVDRATADRLDGLHAALGKAAKALRKAVAAYVSEADRNGHGLRRLDRIVMDAERVHEVAYRALVVAAIDAAGVEIPRSETRHRAGKPLAVVRAARRLFVISAPHDIDLEDCLVSAFCTVTVINLGSIGGEL